MKKENCKRKNSVSKENNLLGKLYPESVTHKVRTDSGITLIALVITVIVLLILAGVALKLIAGGDGILGKAEKAVNTHTEAEILERLNLKMVEYIADKAENQNVTVDQYLATIEGCTEVVADELEDNPGGYIVTIEKYAFQVSANGEVLGKAERTTEPKIEITQDGKNIEISVLERGETITVLEILDRGGNVLASAEKEDMTQNEKGYVFNHTFTDDGTYIVKVTARRRKGIPKRG